MCMQYTYICMHACSSHIRLFVTPWTVACQAPLSMEFSRQGYWSGVPFPTYTHAHIYMQDLILFSKNLDFSGGSDYKESAFNVGGPGSLRGLGRSLEKGMAIHSSILAWRSLWAEEPDGLQSLGSQRVKCDSATNTHTHTGCLLRNNKFIQYI